MFQILLLVSTVALALPLVCACSTEEDYISERSNQARGVDNQIDNVDEYDTVKEAQNPEQSDEEILTQSDHQDLFESDEQQSEHGQKQVGEQEQFDQDNNDRDNNDGDNNDGENTANRDDAIGNDDQAESNTDPSDPAISELEVESSCETNADARQPCSCRPIHPRPSKKAAPDGPASAPFDATFDATFDAMSKIGKTARHKSDNNKAKCPYS